MFPWWHDLESVAAFNTWMLLVAMIGAALTTVSILLLWINGNRMIRFLSEREARASRKIKAVEKAAEQIRKELLATQQTQDIADQRRRLAEMDAGALRKEMERTRKRYADAEGVLKNRIDELKDINITQGTTTQGTTTQGTTTQDTVTQDTVTKDTVTKGGRTHGGAVTRTAGTQTKTGALDAQQRKMLAKMLSSGPKGEVDIISVLEDPVSHETALALKQIFEDQGWSASEIIQSAFSHPPEGLVLVIHSKATAPSYAKFLQRTLTTIGLPVSAQISAKYREWSISLIVGLAD
jgi:hypothetical protein